mmetsp:Transcript_75629/g.227030  ORF Transcript_75629/g.227030 Transcript_75629/m.227030 type:complete len:159 (+) Transcript_75629:533-1009(+)
MPCHACPWCGPWRAPPTLIWQPHPNMAGWSRSEEPELNVQLMPPQGYAVYCLDGAGRADLRASTRSAHLAWLEESGRVHLAGPLHDAEDDASRIGSFLVVNGDDSDEVARWAAADPYAAAGLFASVVVAPLLNYAVPRVPLGFQPLDVVTAKEEAAGA